MNLIVLSGRLVADPELKTTGKGTPVAKMRLAVDRGYSDETDFFNMTAFGKKAEAMAQYLHKGRMVLVNGHVEQSSYDDPKTGQKRYFTDVIIDNFDFIDSRGGQQQQPQQGYGQPAQPAQPNNSSYGGYGQPGPSQPQPGGFGPLEIDDDFALLADDDDVPF